MHSQPPVPAFNPYAAPSPTARPLPATEQVIPGIELATPGIRLLARIVDNIVFFAPILLFALVEPLGLDENGVLGLLIAILLLCLGVAFAQIMLICATGATIGKRLCGIKMIRHDGSDVGFVHGWLIRTFLFGLLEAILGALFFYIPNLVDACFIFSKNGQTLHDRMAGTYVIKAR